ncbi:MAG: DUF362 domain-containing protein [Candidatus Omnitrophota bacterium]
MESNKHVVTRRDFVYGTMSAAAAVSIVGAMPAGADEDASTRSSSVVVVRDEKVQGSDQKVDANVLKKMLEETVVRVTGKTTTKEAWLSLVTPNDVVGLVSTPHLNPTHNEVVDAVKAGLMEAGIPEKNILLAQGGPDKAKACTALIGLPSLKAHWLTGIGTVMKLYIMYSGKPRDYHGENNAKLGEIWNLPDVKGKTKLMLVDALRPLCDKGPQPDPQYMWNYNGLIAGADPVAVETVCLKIISEKRRAINKEPWPLSPPPLCVEAADKVYKLGTSNLAEIKIEKFGWMQDVLI